MKISYRNQAVLKMVHTGSLGPVAINAQDKSELTDELLTEFGKLWKINAGSFNKNIRVLSIPFAKAVHQSVNKLTSGDLIDEAFLQNTSGTIVINDRTICYTFERINEEQTELTYYFFQKNVTEAPELKCFVYIEFDRRDSSANTQSYIAKSGIYESDQSLSIEMYTKTLIATLNFIKYADIDIRCKYVNETSSNIQFLDSTWFTTLIKSDGFKVRGHFRLQPKRKNGEWTKEIIWINEFEKTGYISLAKKLIE